MRRREFIAALGIVALRPTAMRAQQSGRVHRIALVHPSTPASELNDGHPFYRAFFGELRRLGHAEGTNLAVARYSGGGMTDHYAQLAEDVIRAKPEVVVTNSSRMVLHFKTASSTMPIVAITSDPVALGIAESLAHPGGTFTGSSSDTGPDVYAKQLQLLKEALPKLSSVGIIATAAFWQSPLGVAIRNGAEQVGIRLVFGALGSHEEADYRNAFRAISQDGVDAVLLSEQAEHFTHRQLLVELAATHRLPTVTPYLEIVEMGGLMAYAPDRKEQFRYLAACVDKIMRGTSPGEIPIYQVKNLHLAINLKTAKTLGIDFPPTLLASADEVVE